MNNNEIRVKVNEWIFIQNINTNKYSKKCKKLTWTVVLKNKFWKELKNENSQTQNCLINKLLFAPLKLTIQRMLLKDTYLQDYCSNKDYDT